MSETLNWVGSATTTRYPEIGYRKEGPAWRFVDMSTDSAVGPQYPTKAEMLADLQRYAEQFGAAPITVSPQSAAIADAAPQLLEAVLRFRHAIAVAGTSKAAREALAASHDVMEVLKAAGAVVNGKVVAA